MTHRFFPKWFDFVLLFTFSLVCMINRLNAQDNFWNNSGAPNGGQITGIACSPAGETFAGTGYSWFNNTGGKVYFSSKEGEAWTEISSGLPVNLESINCFAFHPDGDVFCGTSSGVYRFVENDTTWLNVSSGLPEYDVVNTIVINQEGAIFIGTTKSVYRSESKGESWMKKHMGSEEYAFVNSLVINSSGDLFAGTDRNRMIFRSSDNGEQWSVVNAGLPASGINALIIDERDYLFAGLGRGVFFSNDNGNTWISRIEGLPDYSDIISMGMSKNGELFVGYYDLSRSGIYSSTDDGLKWNEETSGLPGYTIAQAFTANLEGSVVAGTYNGIFRHTNDQDEWTNISKGLSKLPVRTMTKNSVTGSLFIGAGFGIYRSGDNGETWLDVSNGFNAYPYVQSVVSDYDGTLYAGVGYEHVFFAVDPVPGGIHRSTDNGVTWESVPQYFYGSPRLAVNQDGTIWANGYYDPYPEIVPWGRPGLFRSMNSGESWDLILDDFRCLSFDFKDGSQVSVGTFSHVFLSSDNGQTWGNFGFNSAVQSLAYDSGGNLFAATSGDLFRMKQNEENWETLQTNFRPGEFSSSLFVADNDDVFASTNTGALFRSVDHGDTWEQVIDDSPGPSTVNCLFKDYNNYLFAGTDKGMLRSQFPIIDVAQPLIEIESDSLYFETAESLDTLVIFNKGDGTLAIEQIEPTSYYAYRVEAIHNDSSFIWYVYKNHNIYESLENKLTILPGDSASLIFTTADLCPVCKVSSINRFFSDTLLVYTNDYTNYPVSIFASGQGMPSSVENDEQIKRKSPEFHLYPNYPNPFNPSTKIPFVLDKPAFVELTIYDVTGRIVVQLLQERRPAGQQTVLWHAQGMNSGVYFCKLQAGNQVQSIKLLLVK